MVKLSVIIPVYNVEKYIDECVSSVLNQTLRNIEIILVDDESPDNCPILCDEYSKMDSRVKVIHKKNGGLGFARNSGIEVATGEYVTFLDSDDFVDNDAYEKLIGLIEASRLDLLYYKFRRFSNGSDIEITHKTNHVNLYKDEEIQTLMLDIIASGPLIKNDHIIQCSSCTAVYKRDIIEKNNIRFHSERELISEDLIFNLDFLSCARKVAYNESEYYHYRVNPISLTGTVRIDRISKNLQLYDFININLNKWRLTDEAVIRNKRLFIGNSRSSIVNMLNSSREDSRQWLKEVLSYPIWTELYQTYPWRSLPEYQKFFFLFCYHNCYYFLKFISWLRK